MTVYIGSGEATADHNRNLQTLEHGIVLSPGKMNLQHNERKFPSWVTSRQTQDRNPIWPSSIIMPRSKDIAGVQCLNGFINYLAKVLPLEALQDNWPIRHLTLKNTPWQWSTEQHLKPYRS